MKKYSILSGALAAAALCGTNALAQLSYSNGDLLAAFGKSGSSVDVIVDLGSIAQFQSGGVVSLPSGVGAALTTEFGGTSGVYWAVFGVNDTTSNPYNHAVTQTDANTVWDSIATPVAGTPKVSGSSDSQGYAVGDIETIAGLAANATYSTTLSSGVAAVSSATQLAGFTYQFANGGNLNGDWSGNMLNTGSGLSDLYQSNPGNPITDKQTLLGSFTLNPDGILSFNTVPEPSTLALLGGGLASVLFMRRRNR